MTLPEFSVRQVVLVNVLFFVCLGAGFIAFERTPVDYFPQIDFNTVAIATSWTGASADEIERLVTTRIEEQLVDIEGIDEISSTSRAGVSQVLVRFDETMQGSDFQSGVNDLRAAVDRVIDLPADADEPFLLEINTKTIYSDLRLAVVDLMGHGPVPLHEVARDVRTRLEDLRGVERVTTRGDHEREVRVLVDRDAAARFGLTVIEIANSIRQANLNLPAGSFRGASGESILRATGDFESLEQLSDTIVRDSRSGTPVRLRDVASIEAGIEKRSTYLRYNGKPALMLGIAKEYEADVISVSRAVDEFIAEYEPRLPAGMELKKTWDTSEWVEARISVLSDNLLTGVVLVMAILWFTIGFRNAALTIIAIPFSFLSAMVVFPLLGITINAMSLVGMLLVSGMLVDDAIIVLENIYRHIEDGEELREAVVKGANEVLWPVVAAVTTSCAAFAPLLLIEGIAGKFMEILPITVILCLVASLFECLIILPAHYLDFGSRHRLQEASSASRTEAWPTGVREFYAMISGASNRLRLRIDGGITLLRGAYVGVLDRVLEYPMSFATLAASLLFLAIGVASRLDVDLFPSESNNFFVTLETPPDWSLDQTDEVMAGVELQLHALLGDPLEDYFTTVGTALAGNDNNRVAPNLAVSFAWIVDTEEYREDPDVVLRRVREQLNAYAAEHPDEIVDLQVKPPRNGPPIGRPVAVRISADSYSLAKSIALDMQGVLRGMPGVTNIEDNLREGRREVRLVTQPDRAARLGLSFQELAETLRAANDGLVASSFRDPLQDEEFDIRVMHEERFRSGLNELLQTEVRTRDGRLVKLGDVAHVEISRGVPEYWHYDRRRTVTVYADVDLEATTALAVNQRLEAEFADVPVRHPEVDLSFGGEAEATREMFEGLIAAFPIAMLSIYGILAALFRSYVQPLVVATAIPFGFIGVILGTLLLGYDLSMSMMYGTIGLTGVVVNDALVMVDFINRARAGGMPLREAIRQSGARRLRPILLTTFTTVLALMPMALGWQGGSASFGPFAASITFGLLVAMFGTLFIVPLSYSQVARLEAWFGRQVRRSGGSSVVAVAADGTLPR